MERIALAREYQVAEWLRDVYMELTQKESLNFDELQPTEPYSSSESNLLDRDLEADAKIWKTISRDWETLAGISVLQTKVANSIASFNGYHYCNKCYMNYGMTYRCLCRCRLRPWQMKPLRRSWKTSKRIRAPNIILFVSV